MKIAICDDDPADLELIKNYCKQFDPGIKTTCFYSGESLLAAFNDDFYDLVFLDIEMGRMNGLEVGTRLIHLLHKPIIVFTTQSLNYAVRGYGIAMRYLPKPISFETFSNTMYLALDMIQPKRISVTSNGLQLIISVNKILYFEVFRHYISIHLVNGEMISTRGTLTEIISQIPGGSFVQPHKSYYINMEYIDRISPQIITMTNGSSIPIGRSKKDGFQTRLSDYMKGNHLNEHFN